MKLLKRLAFVIVVLAFWMPIAQAEFRQDMTLAEIETEVRDQVAAGRSANDVAREALGVGLDPGIVTAAMINVGVAPLVAIGATINAGAPREAVRAGALVGGVPIAEALTMIVVWLPEANSESFGYSLVSASDPTPDLGSAGGSGGGTIASPN